MAKTRSVRNFRPVGNLIGGGPCPTFEFEEGASQTFAVGDPVAFSGGRVVVHPASTTDRILGFAAEAGHNSAAGTDKVTVWLALPNVIYEGSLVATASTDHVLLITNIGVAYGLVAYTPTTPDTYCIDVSETTDPLFKVIGVGSGDTGDAQSALGDTNARVQFVIPANVCEIMSYGTLP